MRLLNWPFQRKLNLAFFISIIIPLAMMAVATASYFEQQIRQQDRQAFSSTLYAVSQTVETYLDDLQRLALSPNLYPELMETYVYINSGGYDLIPDPLAYNQITGKYRAAMQKLLEYSREDAVGQVFIPMYNPNSNMYVVSRTNTTLATVPIDPEVAREWIASAEAENGRPVFSPSHTVSYYGGEDVVFSVIALVKDVYKHQNVGVIKADISAEQVERMFANIETSSHSVFLLLDQNGSTIYATREDLLPEEVRDQQSLYQWAGDSYSIYSKAISPADWNLVYLSSEGDLARKMLSIYAIIVLIGCLTLAAAAVIFHVQSRRMGSSLHSITHTMEKAEQGDLAVRAARDSGVPEFDTIGKALNHMIAKLDRHIKETYRAELSRRTAEYNALQAQVNPHFLYNTLNGFIALNRIGEKQLLEDSIIMLTRMFRYSCGRANETSVAEELQFLQQYLSLQKMRYDQRLDYQIEMAPGTGTVPIPKLLIQPLVENSVLHGMEDCPHPVMVMVTADFGTIGGLSDCVVIHVTDNGSGFNPRDFREGVGLQNVRERLELFHPGSFLEIKSHPGQFTRCTVAFPYDTTGVRQNDDKDITG